MSLLFAGIYIFAKNILKDEIDYTKNDDIHTGLKEPNVIEDFFKPVSSRVNFIVMCTDHDGTRTDFMMIGTFLTKEKIIKLISIPRDIYIELTEEQEKILLENDRFLPQSGYLKLAELHHYAGQSLGVEMLVNEIENTFDINIDYYAKLNLEGFRSLIDDMGGVKFNVPQRMLYEDFVQDLYIDLYPGEQVLNGKDAEGLLRYRKPNAGYEDESPIYIMGDLERVKVQQDFVREFIMQLLAKDNIVNNAQAVINNISKYVTTNFNINEVPKYLKYVKDISPENIQTATIPVKSRYVDGVETNDIEFDLDACEKVISEVFYDEDMQKISSKGKKIKVLNGGYVNGLAGKKQEELIGAGFNVTEIGDSDMPKDENTFIYVNKEGLGYDLKEFFNKPRVKYVKNQTDFDIIIVLGTSEED